MIDDEIIEIFLEEAGEVSETLDEYWPVFKASTSDGEALTTVRRAFHTLKGSGRMVNALVIGELAWSIENMFNRVIDKTIQVDDNLLSIVDHVLSVLPALIEDFRTRQKPTIDTQPLMDYAFAIADGKSVPPIDELLTGSGEPKEEVASVSNETERSHSDSGESVPEAVVAEPAGGVESEPAYDPSTQLDEAETDFEDDDDTALMDVFIAEAKGHLATIQAFVDQSRSEDHQNVIDDKAQRALHTLKGSAHMADISAIAKLAAPLERILKELRAYHSPNSEWLIDLLDDAGRMIGTALSDKSRLSSGMIGGEQTYLRRLQQFEKAVLEPLLESSEQDVKTPDPQAISRFLQYGMDSLLDAERLISDWQTTGNVECLQALIEDLIAVAGGAAEAEQSQIADLAKALEGFYSALLTTVSLPTDATVSLATEGQEELLNMMDCLAAGQVILETPVIARIQEATLKVQQNTTEHSPVAIGGVLVDQADTSDQPESEFVSETSNVSELIEPEITADQPVAEPAEIISPYESEILVPASPDIAPVSDVPETEKDDVVTLHEEEALPVVEVEIEDDISESPNLEFPEVDHSAGLTEDASSQVEQLEQQQVEEPPFLLEISVPEENDSVPTLWQIDRSISEGAGENTVSPESVSDLENLATAEFDTAKTELVETDILVQEVVVEIPESEDVEDSSTNDVMSLENNSFEISQPASYESFSEEQGVIELDDSPLNDASDSFVQEATHDESVVMELEVAEATDVQIVEDIEFDLDPDEIIQFEDEIPDDSAEFQENEDSTDIGVDVVESNSSESLDAPSIEYTDELDSSAVAVDNEALAAVDSGLGTDAEPGSFDEKEEAEDLSAPAFEESVVAEDDEIVSPDVAHVATLIDDVNSADSSDPVSASEAWSLIDDLSAAGTEPEVSDKNELSFDGEEGLPSIDADDSADIGGLPEPENLQFSDDQPVLFTGELVSEQEIPKSAPYSETRDDMEAGESAENPVVEESSTQLVEEESASISQVEIPTVQELPSADLYEVEENDDDDEIIAIFLEEAQEIIENVEHILQDWQADPDNLVNVARLQRELHTIKGGARMAEQKDVAELCHELETLYERIANGRLTTVPELFDLLQEAHDSLGGQLDDIRDHVKPQPAGEVLVRVHAFVNGGSIDAAQVSGVDDTPVVTESMLDQDDVPAQQYEVQSSSLDESDREILEIFLEEAVELHESLDRTLHEWETGNASAAAETQRVLHTLKGGARLAGLVDIGNLSHDFEARILLVQQGRLEADPEFFKNCYQRQDALVKRIERVSSLLESGSLLMLGEATVEEAEVGIDNPPLPKSAAPSAEVTPQLPDVTSVKTDVAPAAAVTPQPQQQTVRKAPQELVKVSADLLDGLVNLAGETSIGRGRLEQQVADFSHTLEEMDMTLDRLRDQLRRLDIETEAQVLFRQERQGPDYEDFDPLEMDRYSTIQQLSRALVESASDLTDLRETLGNKTRDAETLLLQQSRVNTELQEGLMKTRMVPFQRLVPRLRRIVRQVSLELGKQVEFRVLNADGELDRTILERMISPLEHMVRNAVDHGVESPEVRASKGKPPVGNIELEISRDGGDVVLTLRDDGDGVNLEAVRKKAIERGMLEPDAVIDDHDLIQFILQAGFSTAKNVTQISGRGVGLDVVSTEIKQMSGSVEIHSDPGAGTRFEVRLPFTVSVNRALMVRVGDDLYAVPLNNIQGIVRISAKDLQEQYEKPTHERKYHYAGRDYRLDYLAGFLDNEAHPKFSTNNMPLPVLLVHGAVPFALQVDTLLGSREIVVKALGPQFGSVMGVSGGTILGDGSVVIILDLPAMIRTQASLEYQQAKLLDQKEAEKRKELANRQPRILVVDDSVTVRKVTTRLLERNGMEVRTAKDGMDAMETLQDHRPDVMLLDIEMPRMDGFEVASLVRHDSNLKHIPIIMITSRTGDKHRDRALSIGVNEYMGKPFQEDQLLSSINGLLNPEDS